MRIEKITAQGIPPFDKLKLGLPPVTRVDGDEKRAEVQIITGPNGTGKSRLLAGVAACAGYVKPLEARLGKVNGECRFAVLGPDITANSVPPLERSLVLPKDQKILDAWVEADLTRISGELFGWAEVVNEKGVWRQNAIISDSQLIYARSASAWLTHEEVRLGQSVRAPDISDRLFFTPAAASNYSQDFLSSIANLKLQALGDFQKHMGRTGAKRSRKEELIARMEEALGEFFGVKFFFNVRPGPPPVLTVDFGAAEDITINQSADGLRSVIGWLVDIVMMTHLLRPEAENPMDEEMIILLDEPETHLHPEWQRRILPLAQRLLPNAQMIVATHSPFVVMSVNSGWIHRLELQADGMVKALPPMKASAGDSYPFVTDVVMGVHSWFDPESEQKLKDFHVAKIASLRGDKAEEAKARKLLEDLASRGEELAAIAGAELAQLNRALSTAPATKAASPRPRRKLNLTRPA